MAPRADSHAVPALCWPGLGLRPSLGVSSGPGRRPFLPALCGSLCSPTGPAVQSLGFLRRCQLTEARGLGLSALRAEEESSP